MAGKIRYLVFGIGMLALVAGVAISVLMLLATRQPGPGAGDAPPGDGAPSLAQTLEQTLGLTEEEAAALAAGLQDAVAQAGPTPVTPASGGAPKGTNEKASVGDSMDFEVRDASGKLKQSGSSQ